MCRKRETQARLNFEFGMGNLLPRSRMSKARYIGEIAFLPGPAQTSGEIPRVEGMDYVFKIFERLYTPMAHIHRICETARG